MFGSRRRGRDRNRGWNWGGTLFGGGDGRLLDLGYYFRYDFCIQGAGFCRLRVRVVMIMRVRVRVRFR